MFASIPLVVWMGLGAGLLVLAFVLLVWLSRLAITKGAHPLMRKFITEAIVQAYKLSDLVFDATGERLHSFQKREVALVVYNLLPETFTVVGFSFNWKKLMTQEMFADKVSALYDEFTATFDTTKAFILDEMLEEIKKLQEG